MGEEGGVHHARRRRMGGVGVKREGHAQETGHRKHSAYRLGLAGWGHSGVKVQSAGKLLGLV